jgi:alkylhydroperoxidase family enzyme
MAMAWIETRDEDAAEGELARLYGEIGSPVDEILAVHSLHPAGLDGHLRLYRAVMAGTPTLPAVEREMIAVVVSRINDCHY